ncbi:tripartite motif-containing protein 2-like [Ptychodera flava]|uniref:tripartite motif-containing protein 2-like n=1 Tax=Ptychodera flava TaxID=63121 RepID=UPI00396A46CC
MATGGSNTKPGVSTMRRRIQEDFLHCGICFEVYENPKCLPCQHSFCQKCLDKHVKAGARFKCPLCNQDCKVPAGGVEKLQPSYLIKQLKDIVIRHDPVSDTKCEICQLHLMQAVCVDCMLNICADCSNHHKIIPTTRKHRIFTVEEYNSAKGKDKALIQPMVYCSMHKQDVLELYCERCHVPVCIRCSKGDHSSQEHKCVSLLSVTEKFEQALSRVLDRVHEKKKTNCLRKSNSEQMMELIEREYQEECLSIERHAEKTIDQVNAAKARLLENLRGKFEDNKEMLKQEINLFEESEKVVDEVITVVNNLKSYGNAAQVVSSYPMVQQYTAQLFSAEIPFFSDVSSLPKFYPNDNSLQTSIGCIKYDTISPDCLSLGIKPQRRIKAGEEIHFSIQSNNLKVREKKPMISREIAGTLQDPEGGSKDLELSESQGNIGNETHVMKFECPSIGRYKLFVKFSRRNIEGSPWIIHALPPWQRIEAVGGEGEEAGEFIIPRDVAQDKRGKLLVVDTGNKRVQKINLRKGQKKVINLVGLSQPILPHGIAVSSGNEYFITDAKNNKVVVSDRKGKVIGWFGESKLRFPWGIAINEVCGYVYVVNNGKHSIAIFAKEGGRYSFRKSFCTEGSGLGQLNSPLCVAINSKDQVIVSDRDNHRIQVFESEGNALFAFGQKGDEEGSFVCPEGVSVDREDNVYVCDCYNNRVQKFDERGRFVCCVSGPSQLRDPRGITVDDANNVIVTDADKVHVFA